MVNAARNLLQKHPSAEWLAPLVFCLILLAQMLSSVQQMSQQADESTHLYAGYRILKCGDYAFGREHPPLAKVLAATPLLWSNPPIDCEAGPFAVEEAEEAISWLYSQDEWWHLLTQARIAASLFSVALCFGVWITARRLFGRAVAVLSTAILVFEPNLLGVGALVLNDVLLTALFLFTVFSFYRWTRDRWLPFLVLTGLFAGMAALTKHSALLLIPSLCFLVVSEVCTEKGCRAESIPIVIRNLAAVAVVLVIAAMTIWGGYGMRYTGVTRRVSNSAPTERVVSVNSLSMRTLKLMLTSHLVPQTYVDSVIDVRGLVAGEQGNYILGRYYSEAPWYFYPLTTTIKLTIPFLAMLVLGGVGIVGIVREKHTEVLFLLLPALLYLVVSTRVRAIGGIKYLMPMLPLVLIAAAAGCVYLARRYRWVGAALVCLLVLHAASSLHCYPNYLSYANEAWGGPQNLYKYLPWTDLNQSLWQVSKYMKQHPNTPCWMASYFDGPVIPYDVPCTLMGDLLSQDVPGRMKGIVFVSSSRLQIDGRPGYPLAPFRESQPKTFLGGSAMMVYEGEFDTTLAAARALANKALKLLESGDPKGALVPAARAVELAPSLARAHDHYCVALTMNGYLREGLSECLAAKRLVTADPNDHQLALDISQNLAAVSQVLGVPVPTGAK